MLQLLAMQELKIPLRLGFLILNNQTTKTNHCKRKSVPKLVM